MTATIKTTNLQHESAATANITLTSGGNVGISASSPLAKLQTDSTDGTIAIFRTTSGANNTRLNINVSDSAATAGFSVGGNSSFPAFTFSNGGSESMRIQSDGQLLINTTTSALPAKLEVHFDGSATQGITIKNTANSAAGAAVRFVDYTGAYTGGGIYYTSSNSITYATSSDYRLKENVVATTGAVEKVKQLNPVNFNFIGESESVDGFLAHELQTVVPNSVIGEKDAVTNSGENKYQVADYAKLVPLLTAALKEAVEKIETLEARVASLEAN